MKISLDENILNILILLIYLWDVFDAIIPEGALIIMTLVLIIELVISERHQIFYNKSILYILLFVVFQAMVCIACKENSINLFFKAFIGITISYMTYSIVMKKYSVEYIFEKYFKISIFIAAFGLFQEIAFLLKWSIFYDKSYLFSDRIYEGIAGVGLLPISCFFQEQSNLAFSLISAAFVSICILLKKECYFSKPYSKSGAIIILSCCLLSFSSTVYVGILLSFILCGMNSKKIMTKIGVGFLFVLLITFFYFRIDMFKLRVDDMLNLMFSGDIEQANLSSRTLFVNIKVAIGNFVRTFGIGSGLGSYRMVYEKLADINASSRLNAADGNSLFNRVTAELGIVGLVCIFAFLKKNFILTKNRGWTKIINYSCLVCFFTRLLRNGHYFYLGFFFFVVLYVQSKRESILSDKKSVILRNEF